VATISGAEYNRRSKQQKQACEENKTSPRNRTKNRCKIREKAKNRREYANECPMPVT
jgi:hypothetical protein